MTLNLQCGPKDVVYARFSVPTTKVATVCIFCSSVVADAWTAMMQGNLVIGTVSADVQHTLQHQQHLRAQFNLQLRLNSGPVCAGGN